MGSRLKKKLWKKWILLSQITIWLLRFSQLYVAACQQVFMQSFALWRWMSFIWWSNTMKLFLAANDAKKWSIIGIVVGLIGSILILFASVVWLHWAQWLDLTKSLKRTIKCIGWLCLGASLLILYYFYNPVTTLWAPKCLLKVATGLQCPGCGIQRALHALLQGRFSEAIHYNYFLLFSGPYILSFGVRALLPKREG